MAGDDATSMESFPIMVAGCGRSGTSLLKTILDAHPEIAIPSESLFIPDYLRYGQSLPPNLFRLLLYNEPALKGWHDGTRCERSDVAEEIKAIHERYADARGAHVWGQKTPRFIRHVRLIEESLGPCRWILITRDPRAVYRSMKLSGQHTSRIIRACARWNRDNEAIAQILQTGFPPPGRVKHIRYEEFVRCPETIVSELLRFCGVKPLSLGEVVAGAKPIFFPGSTFQNNAIRDGVMPSAVYLNKWRSELSGWEIKKIEDRCRQLMKYFSYSEAQPKSSKRPSFHGLRVVLKDIRVIFRYLRNWPIYPAYHYLRQVILRAAGALR